ncbi:MAG TPA: hypothetical protein VF478_07925 [Anaerolineae bacterium]
MDLKRIERGRSLIYRCIRARRVRTIDDAAHFIDAVGFSLLFASTQGIELPSLFEAVKGRRDAHIEDWDQDSDRVWVWKNDLPASRCAFYGKALAGGKPVFISLKMLPYLFATAAVEDVDDAYKKGRISQDAKRVNDAVRAMGPTPTIALRAALGLDVRRYHRALDELQRALVILPIGAVGEHGAWPSQIFELAARWFPHQAARAQKIPVDRARRKLVARYVQTVVACTPAMIGRVFGWPRIQVAGTVDELIERRVLTQNQEWISNYVG